MPSGDSTTQRQAETVALAALSLLLGVHLVPERLRLNDESYIDVDGVSQDPPILVEVWAHQGPPKSAQRNKVLADAFKLIYAGDVLPGGYRRLLCFTDHEAAKPFRRRSWYAAALEHNRIEVHVIVLPQEWRQRILEAQARQYR